MRRKNIAVCVTGSNTEGDSKLVIAIKNRCLEMDCNALVFKAPIRKSNIENTDSKVSTEFLVRGENEIFNLLNYKILDGVVLLGETFSDYNTVYKISDLCFRNNIPVVSINDPVHKVQYNVDIGDHLAMEKLVNHLIQDHKLKRINFIAGIKEDPFSEERLASYIQAMEKNGLTVTDKNIGYGNFWDRATDVTKQFLADGLPEAIVCANDIMAIFCMDYLKSQGYRIPEDVIVTGFDGIQDGSNYTPKITTVQPDYEKAAAAAIDAILLGKEKEIPENIKIPAKIFYKESCGCRIRERKKREFHYIKDLYDSRESYTHFNHNILRIYTNSGMLSDINTLCENLVYSSWTFEFSTIFLCLNQELVNHNLSFFSDSDSDEYNGLSEKAVSMCRWGRFSVPNGTVFNTSDLLPVDFLNGPEPVFMCFSPLHFKDKFLGYMAYEPTKDSDHGEQYSVWIMTAGNQIGTFYSMQELELLYLSDPFTGLYNRRGMKKCFKEVFENKTERNSYFTVVCADIDYLKDLNDNYGHDAGDNAILKVASAIKQAFPKNSVCVRTGGDEFCVLIFSKTKPVVEKYLEKVKLILNKYNLESGLPYKISCSLGYCTLAGQEVISLDQLQKLADNKLYEAKANRTK